MIEIKEVSTRKMQREFLNFPLKLYSNCQYFTPPLYIDEKKIFNKNYLYYDTSEAVYFNAYENGKMVGRISGILQKASNEKTGEKRVRFTRFDCIDSQEVANKLFSSVELWAKQKGMDTICGPLGFSDLEREGLLIEGFDEFSTFEEQYNYSYYQKLIENCGYNKEVDWVERKILPPKARNERLKKVSDYMVNKLNLHYAKARNSKEFIKKYKDKIFKVLDEAYDDIYGTVPFTEGMKKMIIDNFNLIISLKYVAAILDENENVVCFALCLPSIAKAVQKSKGHLTPLCILRILKAVKKPEIIDLALIGVTKEYAKLGVSSSMIAELDRMLCENGILYAETNLNIEDNYDIINTWKHFDTIQHKRRRSFIKKI